MTATAGRVLEEGQDQDLDAVQCGHCPALLQTLPGEVAKKETDHNNIMRSFPVCTRTSTKFWIELINTSFERSLSENR